MKKTEHKDGDRTQAEDNGATEMRQSTNVFLERQWKDCVNLQQ
ncbi:uncharacterized protein G2W53_035331 [Senna tora]|uniref:Uncharacterized protein n=1 Tax=Senna tora TaxID=362788 RepID=A0A834SSN1_9FABA|nr:uncharacterized protein G2W53_035331 [Senna tora]